MDENRKGGLVFDERENDATSDTILAGPPARSAGQICVLRPARRLPPKPLG